MRKWLKRLGKTLGLLIGIPVVLVLLALLFLQTGPGKNFLKKRILSAARGSLAGELEVDRIEGGLLGGAELYGVILRDARGNVAARIPRAKADWDLLQLLESELSIDSISVERPVVVARRYDDGTLNLATLTKPQPEKKQPPSKFQVSIAQAAIDDGLLVWIDHQQTQQSLSEERLAALEQWFTLLDDPEASTEELQKRIAEILTGADQGPLSVAAASDLELRGSFHSYGAGAMSAKLDKLGATLRTDMTGEPHDFLAQELSFQQSPAHLEATLAALRVGELASLEELGAALAFKTQADELGNRTIVGIDQLFASLDRVSVDEEFVHLFAPDAPVTGRITASATVAGTLQELLYLVEFGCGDQTSTTIAGTAAFPGQELSKARYDAAALFDKLRPSRCLDTSGTEANLTGALSAEGRGTNPQALTANARLALQSSQVAGYRIDELFLDASADEGTYRVDRFAALTPYAHAWLEGHFGLDGDYRVQLALDANEELRQLAEQLGQQKLSSKYARVRLVSEGKLDLDATSPLGYIERGTLNLDWRLEDFQLEDHGIASSKGEVFTRILPAEDQPNARFVEFNADVQGRGIDLPNFAAQYLSVDARGEGVLQVPVDDFVTALQSLSSTWDVRLRRLRAPSTWIRSADIKADIDRGGPGRPFSWDVQGTLQDARTGENQVGRAQLDLDGTAELRQTDEGVELGAISAKGTAGVTELDAAGTKVSQGRVRLDVAGELPSLRGKVNLDATGVEVGGEKLDSIQAQVELKDDRQFEVTAKAERAEKQMPLELEAAGKVGPDFRKFEFRQFQLESPEGRITMPEGATVELTEDGVRFDQLRIQTDDQFLSVEGTFRTRGEQDLRVQLGGVKVGEIREKFGLQELIPPVQATVNGELSIDGTARQPIIYIDLVIRDIYYQNYGPFTVDLEATYKDRLLRIADFEATAYETPVLTINDGAVPLDLDLSGDFDIPRRKPFDLTVNVPTFALPEFYEAVPILDEYDVRGIVGGEFTLEGTLQDPKIAVDFQGRELAFAGDIGQEHLDIQQVEFELLTTYRPPDSKQPSSSKGSGGIELQKAVLTWRGQELFRASASTPMPLDDWVRRTLDDSRPDPDWVDEIAKLPFEFSVDLKNVDLGKIPLKSFKDSAARGTLAVHVEGGGTFADPNATLNFNAKDFSWKQFRDVTVTAQMNLQNQVVTIEQLHATWDSTPVLFARGSFPLPTETIIGDEPLADLPVDLAVQLNAFEVEKLQVIDYAYARVEGQLAGYATIEGTLSSPQIEGRVGLFNTEFAKGESGTIALRFNAENGRINADASICQSYRKIMTATATAPVTTNIIALTEGESVLDEGSIHAEIESERLQLAGLLPEVFLKDYVQDVEGILEIDADIDGTWEEPRFSGKLLVEDGAVTLSQYGRRFTDVDVEVTASAQEIEIAQFQVHEGESWVRVDGSVQMTGFDPTSLSGLIRSKEFNFGGFGDAPPVYVTSKIEVTGDFTRRDADKIRAHATELEATIPETEGGDLHPSDLDSEIIVRKPQTDEEDILPIDDLLGQPEAEKQARRPLHIQVIADRGSVVNHPVAQVFFTADFTAMLQGSRVSMLGSVDTTQGGQAELLGKEFDIPEQENAVRFTGVSPPNPSLDILAVHPLAEEITDDIGEPTQGEPRIIVRVRGRADDPQLVLESDPLLSETEIIFVLMTGRPPGQAGAGEESRVSGLALGAATGLFASLLQERLAGTLPLDVVRVQPGKEGFRDARVQVGSYITEQIFVSYSLRLGAEEGEGFNIFKIDYRFASDWKLELQSSEQLTGQFNIFWDVY